MSGSLRSNRMMFRVFVGVFVALVALGDAVSPAFAASDLTDLEYRALAVVAVFGAVILAIAFEIWRLGLHKTEIHQRPAAVRSVKDLNSGRP